MPTSTDKVFSLEDVQSVLANFFASELSQARQQGSGVTQYVGARYVPLFANPIEWDSARAYEPLTIVVHQGNSYTSRQSVPTGIDISDDAFWAMTGNYNAQVEQYRSEVAAFSNRISQNAVAIAAETERAKAAEEAERQRATAAEGTKAPIDHASEETVYGIGDAVNYGHVRVADADADASGADAGVAASPKYVTDVKVELTGKLDELKGKLGDYYTKGEADGLFVAKTAQGDSILACVGDSVLAGWSNENPNNIPAWDTYLGRALGFSEGNIYKQAVGGAGFDSETTIADEVNTLKATIQDAGKKLEDVTIAVLGAGINDVRNKKGASDVKSGAQLAVTNACNAFPNAEIHIFPMVTGWANLCGLMLDLESAINDGALNVNAKNKIVTHTGVWSWNYDGNDSGVSSDGIHLLAGGESKVGRSMAIEINGGSAYREGYQFNITNAQGTKIATGHRRGATVSFKVATNLTSIPVSGNNATLGLHPRYCVNSGCLVFSQPDEAKNVIMFCDHTKGFFNSYKALANTGVYGNACYAIENTP